MNNVNGYVTTGANTNITFTNTTPLTLPFGAFGTTTNATFQNLTINGAGITLSENLHVLSGLNLTNGNISSSDFDTTFLSGALVNGASVKSFIDGPVCKTLTRAASNVILPTGNNGSYLPVTFSNPSAGYFAFRAYGVPHPSRTNVTAPIASVSNTGYYSLNCNPAVTLTLPYHLGIGEVSSTSDLEIATYSTAFPNWTIVGGQPAVVGNTRTGTITTDVTVAQGLYAVASTTATLPVTFENIAAISETNGALVTWKVAQQLNMASYIVERSTDGKSFIDVATLRADASDTYSFKDESATGTVYYRIEAKSTVGNAVYSKVVAVKLSLTTGQLSIYPSPANGYLQVSTASPAIFKVLDVLGHTLSVPVLNNLGNKATLNIAALPAGIYHIEAISIDGMEKSTFIKK